jgi:hypothetical protein
MSDQVAEILHPVLQQALASLADRDLSGKLVTVTKTTIRIRGQA